MLRQVREPLQVLWCEQMIFEIYNSKMVRLEYHPIMEDPMLKQKLWQLCRMASLKATFFLQRSNRSNNQGSKDLPPPQPIPKATIKRWCQWQARIWVESLRRINLWSSITLRLRKIYRAFQWGVKGNSRPWYQTIMGNLPLLRVSIQHFNGWYSAKLLSG